MPRKPETKREHRSPAVGRNRHTRRNRSLAAIRERDDAANRPLWILTGDDRPLRRDARLEFASGADRVLQQQPVEIAAHDRAAVDAGRITALDRNAALAGDHHAVHAKTARFDVAAEAETLQDSKRAWIDRVAAQLVAREGCPIDQAHAGAGAREDDAGNRPGGPCANDDDVTLGQ